MQILQQQILDVSVMPDITEPATRSILEGRLSAVIYVRQATTVQEVPVGLFALQMPTTVFQDLSHQLHAVFSVSQRRTEELKPQHPRIRQRSVTATLERRSVLYKTLRLLITRMLASGVLPDTHFRGAAQSQPVVVHAVPGIINQIRTQHRARYARPGSRLREFLRQQHRVSIASREVSGQLLEP